MPYVPRAIFRAYHDRLQRWAVIVAHRRAGKTVATINDLVKLVMRCTLPNPRGWYISPTYSQSKKVAWTYLKDAACNIPGYKANEAELRVDLLNDYRVQLAGADNPDSLRGAAEVAMAGGGGHVTRSHAHRPQSFSAVSGAANRQATHLPIGAVAMSGRIWSR